jgi:dTDP-glucose 4,6-dehydratase
MGLARDTRRVAAGVASALVRVLVTGGAGFIGSHFVKRLVAVGDSVVVLDKLTYSGNLANLDGVEHDFVQGDIADPSAVAAVGPGCDAVVNFAAETHVDRSILEAGDFIRTDVVGTHVLLEWVRANGVRFVHVSTDEVYGDVPPGRSSREDDPLRPSSPYSASKAGGDLQLLAYVRTYGVDACVTRGSNTYGPNQYPEKLIPLFVTNALDGEPLPVYGDGRQTRDWLHVRDHCAGIERVLRRVSSGEVYNVGGGDEVENIEVTRRILELTGADPELVRHVEDRPGHDRRYSLDTTKLGALGWSAEKSFAEGLAETVEWYRARRDWWEPIKSGEYRQYYAQQYAQRLGDGSG